eukprot:GHVN01048892.1.p1 GENE.GHVN01048892.1~~GHVN01048892.1.p1  ORF type:complete len:251 (-),score=54.37 GHVN01048892.1:497-1249(-)
MPHVSPFTHLSHLTHLTSPISPATGQVVVFDGMALPSKQGTDEQRRRTREAAAAQGIALHRVGRIKEAEKLFTKAVTITAETAASLIRALSLQGIEVIVAPYEADAQLAYLSRQGLVDVVISEDSDLLPFGCRSVFYKLDHNGGGYEIEWNSLTQQSGLLPPCFFTLDNLISLCVLSGCDYLQSVSGVGVKTAAKMMQACNCNVDQVVKTMRFNGKTVPNGYLEQTYLHHLTVIIAIVAHSPRSLVILVK